MQRLNLSVIRLPTLSFDTIFMNFRYDIWTGYQLDHHGEVSVPVHPDRIPVYQRGGTIIPKKERIRRSSALMANDPITLIIALDKNRVW